jgi:TRAP-type C4-dicarboxylate transport system permease small subunit
MRRLETLLGIGAGAALFLMMLLTFMDVVGRKLAGGSIPGAVELTELLMLLVIFVGLPLTSLRGEHVVFDLLDALLPAGAKRFQHFIAHLVCIVTLLGAAWLVEGRALRAAQEGDRTAQLALPVTVPYQLTALMLLVTAFMHLHLLWRLSGSGANRNA